MNTGAIGVFDSGLGGLTAVKQMLDVLPNENIVYFGDTGRVPYGTRSNNTIHRYALQDARFLLSHNVKMIVAACGTVSSVCGDLSDELGVAYTGVVLPTCYSAVNATKNAKIGVIGTSATINSHSYKKRICSKRPDITVLEQDCPLFVPLVENGVFDSNDRIVQLVVEKYLCNLKEAQIDTLILGCTHYPILHSAIKRFMGDKVTLIDSGRETALYTKKLLIEKELLSDRTEIGLPKFFVSDTPENFEHTAGLFLGRNMEHSVDQIDIEAY